MSWISTGVVRKRTLWAVQAQSDTGEHVELKYRTEAQARYFAAVLSLGPSRLPALPKARITRKLAALAAAPAQGAASR